jgi:YegS/Rv2252/BmrU family lipid kinase
MALVLLNPHAQGGRAARLAQRVEAWLSEHAPQAKFASPHSLDDSLNLLSQQASGTRVVAIGGDGTLNRWLPMVLQQQLELGLVPLGSGNDTARAIGVYGHNWQTALRHGLHGHCRPMDIGMAVFDGQRIPFLSSFTAGFDSAVGKRALDGPKWLRGMPRYVWATLNELANIQAWDLRIHINGKLRFEGASLFASSLNTPTFGSGMPAAPKGHIEDGQLDVLHAGEFSALEALWMLPKLLTGTHLGHEKISLWPAQTILIESKQRLPVASDGEYLGTTHRLELHVLPKALSVVMNAS